MIDEQDKDLEWFNKKFESWQPAWVWCFGFYTGLFVTLFVLWVSK